MAVTVRSTEQKEYANPSSQAYKLLRFVKIFPLFLFYSKELSTGRHLSHLTQDLVKSNVH